MTLRTELLWQALYTAGADVILNGHDHDYERTLPQHGITYVVAGAGAKLTPVGDSAFTAVSESRLHFLTVDATSSRLAVEAVDGRRLCLRWTAGEAALTLDVDLGAGRASIVDGERSAVVAACSA